MEKLGIGFDTESSPLRQTNEQGETIAYCDPLLALLGAEAYFGPRKINTHLPTYDMILVVTMPPVWYKERPPRQYTVSITRADYDYIIKQLQQEHWDVVKIYVPELANALFDIDPPRVQTFHVNPHFDRNHLIGDLPQHC
jgi:hypothetical protein